MAVEVRYAFPSPPGRGEIIFEIDLFLKERDGRAKLEDLEERLMKKFKYNVLTLYGEKEMGERPELRSTSDQAYRVEDGMVLGR